MGLGLVHGVLALLELGNVDFGFAAVLPAEPNFSSANGGDHSPRKREEHWDQGTGGEVT